MAAAGVGTGAAAVSGSLVERARADESLQMGSPSAGSTPVLPFHPLCGLDTPLVWTEGPYVVFREWIAGDGSSVFVYDVGLGKYWIALDRIPLTEVLVAGEKLIVWSGDQILRVGLHGYTERLLFEHKEIQELRLSPDMNKLAVSYGRPLNLTVFEVGSGQELLTVEADDSRLLSLRQIGWLSDDNPGRSLTLGEWSEGSDELNLRAHRNFRWSDERFGLPEQLAIISLDDEMSVLPEGWLLSAGLRYGLNPGELVGADRFFESDKYLWSEFDVVDMQNGELLWTVEVDQGQGIIPSNPSVWGRWRDLKRVIWGSELERLVYFEYGDRLPVHAYEDLAEAAARTWWAWDGAETDTGITAHVLDLESGINRELTHHQWIAMEESHNLISRPCLYSGRGGDCLLTVESQVLWQGSPHLIGVIQPEQPLALRGIILREQEQLTSVSDSRPNDEIVGPLVSYTLRTAERGAVGQSGMQWFRRDRLMVHDAGTGQTWPAFDWRVPFGEPSPLDLRLTLNGFVVIEGDVVRFADLQGVSRSILFEEALRERESIARVAVSPDGRYVAIMLYRDETPVGYVHPGEGNAPASFSVLVVEIASARTTARLDFEYAAVNDFPSYGISWNEEGTALGLTAYRYSGVFWAGTVYPETGEFSKPPTERFFADDISPDFRHGLRVWMVNQDAYSSGPFRYSDRNEPTQLHVFDYASGEVVWRSEILGAPPYTNLHDWHSAEQVFWISGGERTYFDRQQKRVVNVMNDDVISIANVSTGEVKVMNGAEYLEWIESATPEAEAGAVVDCPDDREQLCQVLLEDSVIGEGRWLRVVGEMPVD
ncbi:MAG: hypothetical protein OXD50_10445 [Chloroflexi bacterium]|nr:hypothetical protein [Chloroflexota bacterium]